MSASARSRVTRSLALRATAYLVTVISESLFLAMRLTILYHILGEETEEDLDPTQDSAFNAFFVHVKASTILLRDVQDKFPLGRNYHFTFLNEDKIFIDILNPGSAIPLLSNDTVIAQITPLFEAPRTICLTEDEDGIGTEAYDHAASSLACETKYNYDRHEIRETKEDANNEERTFAIEEKKYSVHKPMDAWSEVKNPEGEPARGFIRKQTEQAFDFAKAITADDAKKIAAGTALKAKKWGSHLISSLNATISQAKDAIRSDVLHFGNDTVNVVRSLTEDKHHQVLLVRNASGDNLVVKRYLVRSEESEREARLEREVYQTVKHMNVMPLIQYAESGSPKFEVCYLIPYFEKGSLKDAITKAVDSSSPLWPFTEEVALHLFRGICAGVLAVHRAGFCHCDIRSSSIILSSPSHAGDDDFLSFAPILTNFGSCVSLGNSKSRAGQAPNAKAKANREEVEICRAPELSNSREELVIDGQSDVWSLGCILHSMAFGKLPVEYALENKRLHPPKGDKSNIRHRNAEFSPEFCEFISDMLSRNPCERPTVEDALEFTAELLNYL